MSERAEPKRLYEQVAAALAQAIIEGAHAVGERLPSERDLAAQFGVSRPTIREAIIALELDGLVEVRMGSGVYVRTDKPTLPGATDIGPFELFEARRAIESEAAAMAAARISDAALAELTTLLAEMETENERNVEMSEDADMRFHLAIARATQNSGMEAAVEMLWAARARSPQAQALTYKVRAAGVKPRIHEHAAILDALAARDPARARRAMHEHISRVIDQLLKATEAEAIKQTRASMKAARARYMPEGA